MKNLFTPLMVAAALTAPALAQQPPQDRAAPAASATPASQMTEGEIRRIDKGAKKLTIKHGEIKNLGMGPMTMVFQVKDEAVLDKLQPGDKVRFKAVSEAGNLTVIEIQPAK